MEKHSNHSIDERAKLILKAALPPEQWQVYDISPDYGKDFPVELVDNRKMTGETFLVQLKGTAASRSEASGAVSFRLKAKDISYFMSLQHPLFLVVANVKRKVGYWLFMQQYVRENLPHNNWQRQTKVTVKVPASNLLADAASLRSAVRDAIRYMAEAHPAAVEGAIKAEELRLNKLDPRFDVKLLATTNQKKYAVLAKERVEVQMHIKGEPDQVRQKIEDVLDRGLAVELQPGELEVTGSPLMEEVAKHTRKFEWGWRVDGTVNVSLLDSSATPVGSIPAIPCVFKGGWKEFRIEATLPHGLGCLKQHGMPLDGGRGPIRFSLQLRLGGWSNKNVLDLPMFDPVGLVFGRREKGDVLRFGFFGAGEHYFDIETTPAGDHDFADIPVFLGVLRRAREVARRLGVNPPLPTDFTPHDAAEVDFAYDLVVKGEATGDGSTATIGTTWDRQQLLRLLAQPAAGWKCAVFNGDKHWPLKFLRQQVDVPNVHHRVTNVEVVTDVARLRREVKRARSGQFQVRWRGTKGSAITLTRAAASAEQPLPVI